MEGDETKYKIYNKQQKNLWNQGKFENAVNDIAKDSGKTDEWIKFRENWRKKTDNKLIEEFKEIAYNKKLDKNLKKIKGLLFEGNEFKFKIDLSKLKATTKPSFLDEIKKGKNLKKNNKGKANLFGELLSKNQKNQQ